MRADGCAMVISNLLCRVTTLEGPDFLINNSGLCPSTTPRESSRKQVHLPNCSGASFSICSPFYCFSTPGLGQALAAVKYSVK